MKGGDGKENSVCACVREWRGSVYERERRAEVLVIWIYSKIALGP